MLTIESFNYDIHVGLNAEQNTALVKQSSQKDIWFHAKEFSSCHVVLHYKVKMKKIPKQDIVKCAELVKKWTNKLSNMYRVKVMYCPIKYVRLTDKPGTVTLTKTPDEIVV
jgi:predicted ribosome quality control (RQC) complex YloA/Tae2 family protein